MKQREFSNEKRSGRLPIFLEESLQNFPVYRGASEGRVSTVACGKTRTPAPAVGSLQRDPPPAAHPSAPRHWLGTKLGRVPRAASAPIFPQAERDLKPSEVPPRGGGTNVAEEYREILQRPLGKWRELPVRKGSLWAVRADDILNLYLGSPH